MTEPRIAAVSFTALRVLQSTVQFASSVAVFQRHRQFLIKGSYITYESQTGMRNPTSDLEVESERDYYLSSSCMSYLNQQTTINMNMNNN